MEINTVSLDRISINKNILIARDDAFPYFLGGNKARKMMNIINDIEIRKCNAVVTTGGIQSNHCRTVAMACASKGWKCMLILHGSRDEFFKQKGNALIMRMTRANIVFAEVNQIGPLMDNAMKNLRNEGFIPYYLYGGGHNKEGVTAYKEAVIELKKKLPYIEEINHIFLASGTGSTQAGIILGCKEVGWSKTKVHGISIARQKPNGINSIVESIGFLNKDPERLREEVIFHDDFIFGGYGKSNPRLKEFILQVSTGTGLILDETYTGKAFLGMANIIKKEKLTGNILFWHTGGLLNLMS
jgi:D-cysteine desulfhydrase